MIKQYFRHEYTWSGRSISGNKLGWGMVASSIPKDKNVLRELEKMAATTVPDKKGIPVETLTYSSVTGFVKMLTIPARAGEDNRENKLVEIYQPKEKNTGPGCYMAPTGCWEQNETESYLPEVSFPEITQDPKDILTEYALLDRLPEVFRVVYWCLFECPSGINVVAPSWEDSDFAENARKIMYAIHCMLPEPLRKKAGYCFPVTEMQSGVPFCFSSQICHKDYFSLDTFEGILQKREPDILDYYFYYYLSCYFVGQRELFDEFMEYATGYLKEKKCGSMELSRLQWLFYGFTRKKGVLPLDGGYLMEHLPQLLYWASREEIFRETVNEVLASIHKMSFTPALEQSYTELLLKGVTSRSKADVISELHWLMEKTWDKNNKAAKERLHLIEETNKALFTELVCDNYEKAETWSGKLFCEHMSSFDRIETYLDKMEPRYIPGEMKDQIIRNMIMLLNENLFEIKNHDAFDRIMLRLGRKKQWVLILKDFVSQLDEREENLTEDQKDAANHVRKLLSKYEKKKEAGKKVKKEIVKEKETSCEEQEDMDAEYAEAWEAGGGSFPDFLMTAAPQGFLTGCIMYLSNYSLMIGHWKIAVGMAGMWVLLMLNYIYMLLNKPEKYSLWKNIGACIVGGFLIEIIASMMVSQKLRLLFFIILGVLAVLIQTGNIIRRKAADGSR